MKNQSWVFVVSALLAMFFWSFSFVWFKVAYLSYKPMTVILSRLFLATAILFLFAKLSGKFQRIQRADLKNFVLLAFFEPFLYFMGESYGLMYVSSTVAAVIVATIPLMTPFVAWYFFRERLSLANKVGLGVSFFGVCMVVFNQSLELTANPLGMGLEFIAVLAAIGFPVLLKKLSANYHTFTILTYQNLFGMIMFFPFWLVLESSHVAEVGFQPVAFYAIVKLAVFASALAFIFFTYAVKHLGVNRTNVFINLIPVFVAVLAFFILGDQLTTQNMAGIGVVVAGLFLSQIKKRKTNEIHSVQ